MKRKATISNSNDKIRPTQKKSTRETDYILNQARARASNVPYVLTTPHLNNPDMQLLLHICLRGQPKNTNEAYRQVHRRVGTVAPRRIEHCVQPLAQDLRDSGERRFGQQRTGSKGRANRYAVSRKREGRQMMIMEPGREGIWGRGMGDREGFMITAPHLKRIRVMVQ